MSQTEPANEPLKEPEKENGRENTANMDSHQRAVVYLKGLSMGALLTMIAFALITAVVLGRFNKESSGADVLTSLQTRQKMESIAGLISENFYYEEDPENLETWMFKGIAVGLDDPYAAYFSASERENEDRNNEGRYFGIGVTYTLEEDLPVIVGVYEGSAADKAGVLTGDIILSVDGTGTKGLSMDEIAGLFSASQETGQVALELERDKEKMDVTVSFEMVNTSALESGMINDRTGFVRLPQFTMAAAEEFTAVLEELKGEGMENLVLDLRDNPGGLLDSVCPIFGDLAGDIEAVHIVRRDNEEETIKTGRDASFDGPVAVIVNGSSASASELLSAGIQDLKIGPVIGETTYGKGVVQSTYYLRDGSAFKFTTEKYLTAGGRDIDGTGVVPDVELNYMEELSDEELYETAAKEAEQWKRE